MRDPEMWTHTDMYANTDTSTYSIVNPELPAPQIRQDVCRLLGISDRGRDANAAVFSRLTDLRSYSFGSLREEIAEIAPFANDYDSEEPADE